MSRLTLAIAVALTGAFLGTAAHAQTCVPVADWLQVPDGLETIG